MSARARPAGVVLAGASAAQAAVSLVNFGLPSVGPALRDDFELTLFELGAILSAGLLGSGIALVLAGIAVDRFGARLAMLVGSAIGAVGLLVAAAATEKALLFGAMFASGIGSAVVPVAGAGALFRVYPPRRRGWALGVRQTSVPLGGTIAAVGYPVLYAVGGPGLTLGVSAVAVGVTGVLFALVVPGEARPAGRAAGRPFRAIFAAPGMGRLLAVAACYIVVLQALLAYVVPAARESGHTELTAAIAYFGVNVAAMVARIAWGKVADRNDGRRRVRALVEVGVLAAVGALVFAGSLHGGGVVVIVAATVFGLGALGWNALVYVSAGERVDEAFAGRSVAVAATVVFVLSGLVTPVLGALADAAGWDVLWVVTAVTALLGAVLAAGLRELPAVARTTARP